MVGRTSPKKHPAPAAADDIRHDLEALRDDVGHLAQQVADLVSTTSSDTLSEAKAQIFRIRDHIDDLITGANTKGREAADAMRDVTDNVTNAVEESLQTRPFTTLALAAGLGFVLGAIWRR